MGYSELVQNCINELRELERSVLTRHSIWEIRKIWAPIRANGVEKLIYQEILKQGCCDSYSLGIFFGILQGDESILYHQAQLILHRVFQYAHLINIEDVNNFLNETDVILRDADEYHASITRCGIFYALRVFNNRNVFPAEVWKQIVFPESYELTADEVMSNVIFAMNHLPRIKFIGFSQEQRNEIFRSNEKLPYHCEWGDESDFGTNDVIDTLVIYPRDEEQVRELLTFAKMWKIRAYVIDTDKARADPSRFLIDANITTNIGVKYIPFRFFMSDSFKFDAGIAFHGTTPQVIWIKDAQPSQIYSCFCEDAESGWCIRIPIDDWSYEIRMFTDGDILVIEISHIKGLDKLVEFSIKEHLLDADGTFNIPDSAWCVVDCDTTPKEKRVNVCGSFCDWLAYRLFTPTEANVVYRRVDSDGKNGFENPDDTIVFGVGGTHLPWKNFANLADFVDQFSKRPIPASANFSEISWIINVCDVYLQGVCLERCKVEEIFNVFRTLSALSRLIYDGEKSECAKYVIAQVAPFDQRVEHCLLHPQPPVYWEKMHSVLKKIGYTDQIHDFNWMMGQLAALKDYGTIRRIIASHERKGIDIWTKAEKLTAELFGRNLLVPLLACNSVHEFLNPFGWNLEKKPNDGPDWCKQLSAAHILDYYLDYYLDHYPKEFINMSVVRCAISDPDFRPNVLNSISAIVYQNMFSVERIIESEENIELWIELTKTHMSDDTESDQRIVGIYDKLGLKYPIRDSKWLISELSKRGLDELVGRICEEFSSEDDIVEDIESLTGLPENTPVQYAEIKIAGIKASYDDSVVADAALTLMMDPSSDRCKIGAALFQDHWSKYVMSELHMKHWIASYRKPSSYSGWEGLLDLSNPTELLLSRKDMTKESIEFMEEKYPEVLFAPEEVLIDTKTKIILAMTLKLSGSYPENSIGKVLRDIKDACEGKF